MRLATASPFFPASLLCLLATLPSWGAAWGFSQTQVHVTLYLGRTCPRREEMHQFKTRAFICKCEMRKWEKRSRVNQNLESRTDYGCYWACFGERGAVTVSLFTG